MFRVASVASVFVFGMAVSSMARAQEDPGAKPPPQPDAQQQPDATKQEAKQDAKKDAPKKGLQWEVGDYTVKLGGFIKVDLIHDFNEIGSTDSFDPRTIPTDDNDGVNTRMHARSTRLNLDVRGPTSIGPMRLFVEGDFFSDQNGFRMRHAYGTVKGFLGGQTWSTFMDEDAMPETLDFESPIAFPLIRQAQIRYTHDLGDGNYVAVALEDPASAVEAPAGVPGEVEEATPDLTSRFRWTHGLGHCQLGLFAGTARYTPTTGGSDTDFLCGANFSANINVCERDHFFTQITYGPGVGRYRGGITAAPSTSSLIEPIDTFGALLAYEHHWNAEWRSTVSYSWGEGDLPAGLAPDANEQLEYLAANLIWQFCDRAWFGVEYLYGARETADGARGEANRIQFALRFDI